MKRFEPFDGETVLLEERLHWKNYIKPAALLVAASILFLWRVRHPYLSLLNSITGKFLIGTAVQRLLSIAEAIFFAGMAAMAYVGMLRVRYTRYYVTNYRIVAIHGIIKTFYGEMLISRCEMVLLSQDANERLFSSGDILCISAGTNLMLADVRNAKAFKQVILKQMSIAHDQWQQQ